MLFKIVYVLLWQNKEAGVEHSHLGTELQENKGIPINVEPTNIANHLQYRMSADHFVANILSTVQGLFRVPRKEDLGKFLECGSAISRPEFNVRRRLLTSRRG